jgi:hypothetical protein
MCRVLEVFGLPECFACRFIQCNDSPFRTARGAQGLVAVNQNRLAIAPFGHLAAKVIDEVFRPDLRAVCGLKTDQFAILPDHIHHLAINSRSGPGTCKTAPAGSAGLADLGPPDPLAVR